MVGYVLNITPTVVLNTEVSNNIWFIKNVIYDHLSFFGCNGFMHDLKDKKFKLYAK